MTRHLDDNAWASVIQSLPIAQRARYESLRPPEKTAIQKISELTETHITSFLSNPKLLAFALKAFYTTPLEIRGEETYYVKQVELASMVIGTIGRAENERPARNSPHGWNRLWSALERHISVCQQTLRGQK